MKISDYNDIINQTIYIEHIKTERELDVLMSAVLTYMMHDEDMDKGDIYNYAMSFILNRHNIHLYEGVDEE